MTAFGWSTDYPKKLLNGKVVQAIFLDLGSLLQYKMKFIVTASFSQREKE